MGNSLSFTEAARLFDLYCRSKGLSERTVQTYLFAVDRLGRFLARGKDPAPRIPTPQELRAHVTDMLDRGLSRGTIRVRMRSVRVFANFLAREGLVEASPFAGVSIPKVPVTFPEVLSPEQVRAMLRAAKGRGWHKARNYAILVTFLDCGLRLGELIRLDVADADLHRLSLRVRHGKGGKERWVPVGRELLRALRRWMDARGLSVPSEALFCTRDGYRLAQRNVQRILRRIADRGGLEGIRVTPHGLRHSFATQYIRNGGDPFSLQRILGHSSVTTTQIYVNLAGAGLQEAHAKASPVDRLGGG